MFHTTPSSNFTTSTQPIPWSVLLEDSLVEKTLQRIESTAQRLQHPQKIQEGALQAAQQSQWQAWIPSLLSGWSGFAITFTFLARAFPQQSHYQEQAANYIRLAAQATQEHPLTSFGIFDGCSGLAYALWYLSQNDGRFLPSCQKVTLSLCNYIINASWPTDSGLPCETYDVISGASGMLSYLINVPFADEEIKQARTKLIRYLTTLCGHNEKELQKHLYTPANFLPTPEQQAAYPQGYLNCGLAHGIPGIVAALSLAWQEGYRLDGQLKAIENSSRWLIKQQISDAWGTNWPSAVSLEPGVTPHPARAAWCYGTPGVARSLWLAGHVLEDASICTQAIQSFLAVFERPMDMNQIISPTFCHGWAGILMITLRFAQETAHPAIMAQLSPMVQTILTGFDTHHLFCFQDRESSSNYVDDSSLLTGSAGILLTLLAATSRVEPAWNRLFLLA